MGASSIARDITERKQAEQALAESEARFRQLADSIPQLAWIARPNGEIFWYNRRWYEYTGTTAEQMQGWGWKDVHDPQLLPAVLQRWNMSIDTGQPFEMEFPLRGADGEFHWFLTRVMPFRNAQGRIHLWFGTNTNITARKRMEDELAGAKLSAEQAKAAAEQANHAKDRFLAMLSHELRTPLTPVILGASMLQRRPDLNPEVRPTLEMIHRNVAMEARLIDDLLDATRIVNGKVELNLCPIDLCSVIHRAVEVCQPNIEARSVHFGMDLGAEAPYWIEADASRLQQVFWNLLGNAIKFTPRGGCVGIRCVPSRDHVSVEVNDSGIGIDPGSLFRVFNAFEQGERSVPRQFGGLGLGLAISKTLVEMHGGRIEAHSEGQDKGATFRVRLPLTMLASRPVAISPAAGPQQAVRPLHILLVEDDEATAMMMQIVLAGEGHTVETAADVATALQLDGQQRFDLLVSDLGLPDGRGHDLMRELQQRGRKLPGVALSGYGQDEDILRSHEAGFAVHLTKPVSREAILTALASVPAPH